METILQIFLTSVFVVIIIAWGVCCYRMDKKRKKHQAALIKKYSQQIAKMSKSDIAAQMSILFDELEDCYSPDKALEYQMLLSAYEKRS